MSGCEDCIYSPNGKACKRKVNCITQIRKRYSRSIPQKPDKKEYDFQQWYKDNFRADCSGAPDMICNG